MEPAEDGHNEVISKKTYKCIFWDFFLKYPREGPGG